MIDFHSNRTVKATRRPHVCEQCGKAIDAGSPAMYASGKYEGYIYSTYTHVECHAAASAFAKANDLYGEEWPWFREMDDSEFQHHEWLFDEHPVVAARLGIERKSEVA